MKLQEAIELFEGQAEAGEVLDRKTGVPRALSPKRVRVIVSNVRTTLADASGVVSKKAGAIELEPFVAILPQLGLQRAQERGNSRPANVAANIVLFLDTVFRERTARGASRAATRRRPDSIRVLPLWVPLYEKLVQLAAVAPTKRSLPAQLLKFQDLCLANKVRDPYAVPDDFDTIRAWATKAGASRSSFSNMAAAFRMAKKQLGDPALPEFRQRVSHNARGLQSLPDLGSRLAASGFKGRAETLSTPEIIRHLAPKMAKALDRHVHSGVQGHLSPAWVRAQYGMATRILGSVLRLGYDLKDRTWVDLFEQTATLENWSSDIDDLLAEVMGDDYVPIEVVSILRHAIDEGAPLSVDRSPLTVVSSKPPRPVAGDRADDNEQPQGVAFYTSSVKTDVMYAFGLVESIYGKSMEKVDRDRWRAIVLEYESIRDHMNQHNGTVRTSGHKAKDRILIFWPQAVCLGLWTLRQEVLAAERKLDEYIRSGGSLETPKGRSLCWNFDAVLKDYILAALLLEDGLRIKNYNAAIANEHVVPDVVRDVQGKWVTFRHVETHFRGFDSPMVRLKINEDELGAERKRDRVISPGVVDLRLLFRFWTETRPRDLERVRLITSVEEFDPDNDHFTVFIPSKYVERAESAEPWQGSFSEGYISSRFGRVLHWMVRTVLGRSGVPDWDDPARTREWRALFAAHISRALIATYWGGIRGDWAYACDTVDDTERTLRASYVRLGRAVAAAKKGGGIENPHHFDAVADRLKCPRPGDNWDAFWDQFDPNHPEAALAALEIRREAGPTPQKRTSRKRGVRDKIPT